MRCGICMAVYAEPIELPCYHVFCLNCLRRQVTIQKKPDVLPRCAECNREFNMRTMFANKQAQHQNVKVNKLLDVYESIRRLNLLGQEEAIDPKEAIRNNEVRTEMLR